MKRFLGAAVGGLACLLLPERMSAASYAVQAGDILIVNHGDSGVYRIKPVTGEQRKLGTFVSPTDLAVAPDGYLYVSEFRGTIQRLNLSNGTVSVVNSGPPIWTNINGLTLGRNSDLFLTSSGGANHSVVRLDLATGDETEVAHGGLLSVPVGIDLLDADNLAVASLLGDRVVRVAVVDGTQATIAEGKHGISQPWGLAVNGTNIYVACKDSKLLQRVNGTNVTTLRSMALPIFGVGMETNGNIMVGEVADVARVSPAGVVLQTFLGAFNEVNAVDVSRITVEAVGVSNTPPLLEVITNRTVDEGHRISLAATAIDTNWPPQVWTFSLGADAPAGAAITTNGLFTWTPNELQGPQSYPITVVVTDDGDPPLSASNTFIVAVNEVNTSPFLPALTNLVVTAGEPINCKVTATDADLPPQLLTYELLPVVPAGAAISPGDGNFTWTPTPSQAPSTNLFRVKVTDNGVPPLSATNTFTVVVKELNVAPVLDAVTNQTVSEGTLLSLRITATDSNRPLQTLEFSLEPGFPDGAALTPAGHFTWTPSETQGPGSYLITVKVSDSGQPPLWDTNQFSVQVSEVNTPPALLPLPDTNILQGARFTFTASTTDPDFPRQTLTYTLGSNTPAGASISSQGVFSWIPNSTQTPSTNLISVIVSDNGSPPLLATQSFTAVVRPSLAVDPGDILLADNGAGAVFRMNPGSGALQYFGPFSAPTDLALAPSGDLFVCEFGGLIKRLNLTNNTITTINPDTSLTDLEGLAIGPSGELFVTSSADDSITRIDPDTGFESLLTQGDLLFAPHAIDLLDSGHLVVGSLTSGLLVSVDLANRSQSLIPADGLASTWGLAVCTTDIYVTGWDQQVLQRVSDGTVTNLLPTSGLAYGVAIESTGCVVVGVSSADGLTTDILRVTPQGSPSSLGATGLIGPVAGLEVSRQRVGNSVFLETTKSLSERFIADPDASFDPVQRRITTPRKPDRSFYRLVSSWPVRITGLRLTPAQAILDYEFR